MHKDALQVVLAGVGATAAEDTNNFCCAVGYKLPKSIVTDY